ncbi:MAG: acetate--CoA ligase family protein [Promethearchaeota archaeon]|nr:MAG: acetate--CoA ligase family protein [Candidatus Lokiarchaeota archaeon]
MPKSDSKDLDVKNISFINDIKSIVVIGPSKKREYFFLKNHAEYFKGPVYAVHPTVDEIPGFDKNNIFHTIQEIPDIVDFAFIAVPPSQILKIIDDCVKKKVKLVTVFTSEFSDSGTEEGIALEKELLKRAQNKLRILGPNGLGIYYPKLGIAWRPGFPTIPGDIGFIAQSGGICNIAIYGASALGINFSKVFSFGNGADLDFVDLLYFLSKDKETKIILCYLEGIKEGRIDDLKQVLEQNKKPIIVLKGGQSETGSIAAKTHTASISGDNRLWEAFLRQFNIINVDSLEQLLYTARLIDFYGCFELNNLAVFSISGGYGVILVDLLEKAGMNIPPFSSDVQDKLKSKFFLPGTSSKNPLDLAAQFFFGNNVYEIIDLALSDKKIDGLILDMPSFYLKPVFNSKDNQDFEANMIESLNLGHKHNKPLIPIIQRLNNPEERERISKKLIERKVPVFGDPLEFIPLLSKITNYKKRINHSKLNL